MKVQIQNTFRGFKWWKHITILLFMLQISLVQAQYRYYKITFTNASSSMGEVGDVEWMAGSTAYPTAADASSQASGPDAWRVYDADHENGLWWSGGSAYAIVDLGSSQNINAVKIRVRQWATLQSFKAEGSNSSSGPWALLLDKPNVNQSGSCQCHVSYTINSGTTDTQAPSVPSGLTSSSITQTSFTLNWSASTDNVGVTGYQVFRNGTAIGTPTSTTLNVSGLTAGTNYSFTVRARDAAGNWSSQSTGLSVTTSAASGGGNGGPSGYTLCSTEGENCVLSGTQDIAYGANGSFYYRYNQTGTIGCNNNTFGDPIEGTLKKCYVKSGTGGGSDTQAPRIPTGLSSSGVSSSSFTLNWSASTDNVGVTSYEVFRNGTSIGTSASTSFNVSGLSASTAYSMTVRAKDAAGNTSASSSTLSVTTSASQGGGGGGSAVNQSAAIGMNLSGPTPYNIERPFTNLAISALPWMPVGGIAWQNYLPASDLDNNNYLLPNKSGELPVFWDLASNDRKNGQYVCTYEGSGTVTIHTNGNGSVNVTSSTTGKIEFTLSNVNFLFVRVQNGSNPVRNLKIFEKRFDGTSAVFYPEFLDNWKYFKVIRFMDWMNTNNSNVTTWDSYENINDLYQTHIAPEYMVMLCNTLKADAWINIPHQADDQFVTNFLTYFKNNLDPSLKLYVEHSNEVWNNLFGSRDANGNPLPGGQHTYAIMKGRQEAAWNSLPDWEKVGKWHGRRTKQIFDITESVFAGQMNRVVRVTAWQVGGNSYWQDLVMNTDNLYSKTDAYAIAPYVGNNLGNPHWGVPSDLVTSVDDLFAKMPNELTITKNRIIADKNALSSNPNTSNITLIAYEGGQHLVSYYYENETVRSQQNNLFNQANRDPRMKNVYLTMLNDWKANGGKLYASFSSAGQFTQWGSWGAKENPNDTRTQSPKYDALLTFIENNRVTWNLKSGRDFSWNNGAREASEEVIESVSGIQIYPNPSNGSFSIISDQEGEVNVQIINAQGQTIFNGLTVNSKVNIIGLRSGLYFVKSSGITIKAVIQ